MVLLGAFQTRHQASVDRTRHESARDGRSSDRFLPESTATRKRPAAGGTSSPLGSVASMSRRVSSRKSGDKHEKGTFLWRNHLSPRKRHRVVSWETTRESGLHGETDPIRGFIKRNDHELFCWKIVSLTLQVSLYTPLVQYRGTSQSLFVLDIHHCLQCPQIWVDSSCTVQCIYPNMKGRKAVDQRELLAAPHWPPHRHWEMQRFRIKCCSSLSPTTRNSSIHENT